MKQQDNDSPSETNSTTNDPNTCIEKELSNNEFQKAIVKMINNHKKKKPHKS
jgi:hypothetical protein